MINTQPQIIARIRALFDSLMNESDAIPKAFKPAARNLVEGYLKKADPEQIRAIIEKVRDEVIPWILHDEPQDPKPGIYTHITERDDTH
jgi:hypothetical protein